MLCSQVPIPTAWLVIDTRLICHLDFFSLLLTDKQGKGNDCNDSSLPLFSIPSVLRIPDDAAKFLESLCNSSDLVEHVDNRKRFREYSRPLVYLAAFWIRG